MIDVTVTVRFTVDLDAYARVAGLYAPADAGIVADVVGDSAAGQARETFSHRDWRLIARGLDVSVQAVPVEEGGCTPPGTSCKV